MRKVVSRVQLLIFMTCASGGDSSPHPLRRSSRSPPPLLLPKLSVRVVLATGSHPMHCVAMWNVVCKGITTSLYLAVGFLCKLNTYNKYNYSSSSFIQFYPSHPHTCPSIPNHTPQHHNSHTRSASRQGRLPLLLASTAAAGTQQQHPGGGRRVSLANQRGLDTKEGT